MKVHGKALRTAPMWGSTPRARYMLGTHAAGTNPRHHIIEDLEDSSMVGSHVLNISRLFLRLFFGN